MKGRVTIDGRCLECGREGCDDPACESVYVELELESNRDTRIIADPVLTYDTSASWSETIRLDSRAMGSWPEVRSLNRHERRAAAARARRRGSARV